MPTKLFAYGLLVGVLSSKLKVGDVTVLVDQDDSLKVGDVAVLNGENATLEFRILDRNGAELKVTVSNVEIITEPEDEGEESEGQSAEEKPAQG